MITVKNSKEIVGGVNTEDIETRYLEKYVW